MESESKPLGSDDSSAIEFVKEMLAGDPTYAINFDRIQWDTENDCYVIVEYLLCEERQFSRGITPFTSHPNRYFNKNAKKFTTLWELAQHIGAILYLVNYSKKGTSHENEVLLMKVKYIDENTIPRVRSTDTRMTRSEFSKWFRALNKRGRV